MQGLKVVTPMLMSLGCIGLTACGAGGGGSDAETPSSSPAAVSSGRQVSTDIYNPLVYTPVPDSADASGVYLMIQRGTVNYTDHDNAHPADLLTIKTEVARRSMVIVRQEPGLKFRLIESCSNTDFGFIDDVATVVPDMANGRLHASYTQFVGTMPMESDARLSPMQFTAPVSSAAEGAITDVSATMQFDFIRLGTESSAIGQTTFDYTMRGATHTVQNSCLLQGHEKWLMTFVGKPTPNQANSVKDYVWVSSPDYRQTFSMLMETGDAIVVGIGPIGTGTRNQFTFSVESPYGDIAYDVSTLRNVGETGVISQTIIRNNTDGVEITGQAIDDGSAHFMDGSVNTTYHVNARF